MKRVLVLYVVTFLISPEFVGLVKPNLSAHSDIKIEDGDADIQKEVQKVDNKPQIEEISAETKREEMNRLYVREEEETTFIVRFQACGKGSRAEMDSGSLVRPGLLLVISICVCVVSGNPLYTTVIDCTTDSSKEFGPVDEGYEGEVEVVTGITAGSGVKLVPNIFDKHLEYLELSFTLGDTSATVRTKKPLDADTLTDSGGTLFYSIMCDGVIKYNNTRRLRINDINDNSPIFEEKLYSQNVSESESVGFEVVQVRATDADSTAANNAITYSLEPASEVFEVTSAGAVRLKKRLNYNSVQKYNFTVRASDPLDFSDTATVVINVEDFDNLYPYFSHSLYQAFIPENQDGPFPTIEPEAIKAQDGDTGINVALIYSISEVSPAEYQSNFHIDSSSGVLSVQTPIDREEMSSSVISVSIKAAQTDDSLKTANAVVSVTIEDVNDNAPKFDRSSYSVSLLENSPVDAVVFKAVVTDLDQGGFVGTLQILPESAPFSIGSDGTVRVKDSTALDRETTTSFTFQVEAAETNPPNNVATAEVSVTLLDENDNSPVFTSDKYEGKVFANQTVGMLLVQVEAEDVDDGANGQITYSIDFGNSDGYFSIEDKTGKITLAKEIPLVQNRILEFPLYITATDGGTTSRSTAAQVIIRAPGDSKPQFLQRVYHGTVAEEQDPQVLILRVNFLAIAEEKPVILRVDTHSDKFSISSTGEFTTKVKLDYDEGPHNYSVTISISDGVDSDSAVVEVQVTDVNDNSPVFAPSSVTTSVPEDSEVGSNVTVVPATDKDSSFNKEIRYSLSGGEGRFDIDPVSGMVSVAAALDRETKAEYNLLVVAEDQGRPARSATASLLVQVSDINDNIPEFSAAEYQVEVLETESVGKSLLTLSAVDPDEGANGRVSYSILQQSPSSDPAVFELDSSSGTLQLAQPLDYSEVKMYSLMVQASDAGTPSLVRNGSVVVKVKDVNNNPPVFSKEKYDVAVFENLASGASILTLEVTDRDEGGFVGTLRILPESAPFSIGSDGTVRVKDSTALDRETTTSFTFQVEAVETNPPNNVATAEVNVTLLDENDNSPVFTSNKYEAKVFANQTVGMLLVQVEAEDVDDGTNGQITYSIDFGNTVGYFSIEDKTGMITLAKVIPLDENGILEFPLYITATDGGTISRSTAAQVIIRASGDSKPQFSQRVYHGTVAEEQDPQVLILKVNFQVIPEEKPVTLRVDTHSDKFSISSTGEFTTKVKLDYDEGPHNYSVTISISDGVDSDSAVVEVQVTDVNDNSPVFAPSSVTTSVPEDSEVGSNVTVVPATDKDSSFNKEIRYSLRGGEGRFDIDPVSGMVSVAAALDRETKAEYNLLVVAEDQGRPARSATASLLVQVSDINDNIPEFSAAEYQVEVLETESVGKSLLTLSAVDPDEGANGRVSYSILQQSPSSDPAVFELDSSSGTLQLAQPLDYSEVKMYSLMVQASDAGTPSLVRNGSVVVKVKDVNNNPPVFSKEKYDVAVFENLASGASILTLEVTDRDEGGFSNGHFVYTSDTFDINKQGVVTLKNDVTLDRETKDNYILEVVAVDQATDGLRATAQLNITVLDYNDNAPQFPPIADPLQIPEGNYTEENPGDIVTIVPTDADLGPNGEVTLSLSSPHPLFRFREDGTLLAVGALDRESRETHELLVKASDNGTPQRESFTTIRVSLTDVNDNKPEFSSSSYVSSILLKDAEKGKLLLTLEATDKDAGDNSLITYSFSAGSSPYLALDSTTGAVTLTSDLADVKEDTTLVLTATAEDHGEPPLSSTARVVVNLRVVSLVEGVAFGSSSYNFSIPEHRTVGTTVGTVFASSGSDLYDVSYTLKKHSDLFSIDASGAIKTKAELDKEEKEWYVLDVEAVDTRTPPTTAVATVTVQVENVNEPPQFSKPLYQASIVSIAVYKTPVVTVKASDPDVGDQGRLVYSLEDNTYFDVDPSTGLVFVVSAVELAGQKVELKVHADDLQGLRATTRVEVTVGGSVSSSDVVVIRLNQPANTVENKIPDMESSLVKVLGWNVNVVGVSNDNGGASESRIQGAAVKSLVSFICLDGGTVVSGEEVTTKLQSQSEAVRAELVKVFGDSLQFEVKLEVEPQGPASNQAVVIALGVLLALSMMGLMVAVVFVVRFKKTKDLQEDSEQSFDMS
ncbi:cadherin-23-like isoform X6 [Acanthopagrus latus]|uniref:cadherin-23-like isoform X6 n=1 Tax=Acanthopagrus latus TaxID=8177 RepID=UPI00187CB32C|nr:cadherin-23-like isoform X6 [Acanthopagrus latus]